MDQKQSMQTTAREILLGIVQNWEYCSSINAYEEHYELAISIIESMHDPDKKIDEEKEKILKNIRDHRIALKEKISHAITYSKKKFLISEECKNIASQVKKYIDFLELSEVLK